MHTSHYNHLRLIALAATGGMVISILGSCSGDTDDPAESGKSTITATESTPSTADASSTSVKSKAIQAVVDIVECGNDSGNGTASGTISNRGSAATAFNYTIGFYDANGKELAKGSVTTGVAELGQEVEWTIEASGLGTISDDDLNCKTISIELSSADGDGGESAHQDDDFPCVLFSSDEITQIAGAKLDGDAQSGQVSEDSLSYNARACVWTGMSPDTALELRLAVSVADDFEGDKLGCPPPLEPSSNIQGLGTTASWQWIDSGTTETVGSLRVCSQSAFLNIETSGTANEQQQQAAAKALAQGALSKL